MPLATDRVRGDLAPVGRPVNAAARETLKKDQTQMLVTPAYAQAAGGASVNPIMQFLPLILIFAIMYFLMIRPQQKKVKEHQAMINAVRRGDEVVTAGGILGKVTKVKEDGTVDVEIADGVKVRVQKSTLASVVSKTEPAAS